jgi:hypothetical protein
MIDNYYGSGYDLVYGGGSTFWYTGYKYTNPNYEIVLSRSVNNGSTWTRQVLSTGTDYRYPRTIAVDPSDNDRVFLLAYETSAWMLYFTENGGASWQSQAITGYQGTPYRLLVNPSNGNHLAAATSTGLFSSVDGGVNWTRVTTSFGSSLEAVIASDGQSLLVGTSTQGIWLWEGWSGVPTQIGNDPLAIKTLHDSPNFYLYAGTPASSVWRSYYGTGVEGSSPEVAPGFSLAVHPNPVSGGTASISFTLPSQGEAGIAVYDITGRQVETAAGSSLPAGEHTVFFSTSTLSPGVYFARLSHLGSSSTVRMVVTR